MLNPLIKGALNHRWIVLALAALTLVYGGLSLSQLPIDVFPELTKPMITVLTETHGRAPEEVETLVTVPLEFSLTGLPGMERIRSTSGIGLSVIILEFDWGVDVMTARQLVSERLNTARSQLPDDAEPTMAPISSLLGQIQQISISSKTVEPIELRTLAEWVIRPRLMMIPGVTQVIAIGGGLKQYQIQIAAQKLNRFQLSLDQVDTALSKISRNTSGGFFESGAQEFLVRNIGAVSNVKDIEDTVVGQHFGRPVFVKDIAEVKIGERVKRGDGSSMGHPAVVMVIQKQPGSNTVAITEQVDEVMKGLKLPEGVSVNTDVFKQARFINASISGILHKLQLGTVLVFLVLLVFLANLRMSLVTLLAIPMSFCISFIVFRWFGLTINTMTLGGFAIAIGELVDDSIVDVENIFRRLKENRLAQKPKRLIQVVYEASSEVRNSIVLATVIIALVFLPLFQLTGLEGRLFNPLAASYLLALLASLLVSLTLTPALCLLLFGFKADKLFERDETRLVHLLKDWDLKMLERVIEYPKALLGALVALMASALILVPFLGADFLPQFNEGTAMVAVFGPPGIGLEESNRLGLLAEQKLMEIEEVKMVSRRTGRSERDEHAMGVNVSEIDIDFKDGMKKSRAEILDEVREKVSEIPNIGVSVGQPISHLMDHMLSGVNAQIAIKIFGEDLAELRLKAARLKELLTPVKGLVDLRVEQQGLIPQVKVHVLREEAAKFNLSSGEITALLETALNGHLVGSVIEGQRFFELFYRFDESSRNSLEGIQNTVLKTMPNGQKVTVSDVADVFETQGPNEVNRENGLRRIVVSANVSGRDLQSVVEEVQLRANKELELSEGYFLTFGGQFEAQQSALKKILWFGLLSLIGVSFVLYSHFKSVVVSSQVLLTIPFSFIGGIWFLFLSGETLTIASLVGFVTLCGISARNGIMMISHYLHLVKFEGMKFDKEMIFKGSLERMVPVLMTASVTILALSPLLFASGQPGSEILHPVAVVIVGGLITSTLLDMIATPVIFYHFGRKATERVLKQELNQPEGEIL